MSRRTPTRFFLLDPVFAIILAALLIVGGGMSYASMIRENNPDLAIPQATISTVWTGASSSQLEKEVTKAVEDEIRSLPGLKAFASSSQNSFSLVTVQFAADADIESAMGWLRSKVELAQAAFPKAAEKPVIEQISVNDLPIMTLALTGNVDPLTLNRAATRLSREIERVEGVRKTALQGNRKEVVHIQLLPGRMRSLGLSPTYVQERVTSANQDLAWGAFEDTDGAIPLYLNGRLSSDDDVKSIVVGRTDQFHALRLGDIARVFVGLDKYAGETLISVDGGEASRGVTMAILKRPGQDTVATIGRVRADVDALVADASWPPGVSVRYIGDEGEIIEASFSEVQWNLVQGVIAVFAVLLVALTWRAAAVAALALPVTLLGALAAINLLGFTLNTLVTLGMVIALGVLVDVFILVMEGMHEGMSVRGETFEQAALATARTFFFPALAGQATTILAMVPLMMIGGTDGKFIRLIPLTAIACLVISLIVAFVVCIPLSRYLLRARGAGEAPTRIDRITLRASRALRRTLIRGPLRSRRAAGTAVGLALAGFTVALITAASLPSIVYPKEDRRSLGVTVELRPDAGYNDALRVAEKVANSLRVRDELSDVLVHAGEISPYALPTIEDYLAPLDGAFLVGASVRFKPKSERDRLAFEYLPDIRRDLQTALAAEAGAVVRLTPDLGGATAGDPIQIEIRGENISALKAIADDVANVLGAIPGTADIRDTLGAVPTEVQFKANPEALSFFGLDQTEFMDQVRAAMETDKIGTFQMPGSQPDLDILLGTAFESRKGDVGGPARIYELDALAVVNSHGDRIPLSSLVVPSFRAAPTAIRHSGGQRSVTIKAQVEGTTTAAVFDALSPKLEAMSKSWPIGTAYRLRGDAETAAETSSRTYRALAFAFFLVFAIMALLFGSFRQPFIVMAMVPLALTGVFLGFFALGIPVSFAAMIGIVALIGIVVNDAIVMVEVINQRRAEGMDRVQAAAHGASDRLRPILTTSITTIAGLTPLGLSSPAWYPLCMAIILGLSVATILALVIIPAFYVLIEGTTVPASNSSKPHDTPKQGLVS
ncbi:MAG: efflux RND transporter permease subunit [Novosphingobium sp.]